MINFWLGNQGWITRNCLVTNSVLVTSKHHIVMPKWELHAKNLSMHLAFLQRSKKDTSMNIAVKSVNSNAASEKQPIIQRKKKHLHPK